MRSLIRAVRVEVDAKNTDKARQALSLAVPMIDRCAQKNVIPRKKASRIISRLTKAVTLL
jgi:ribosomal protein S20